MELRLKYWGFILLLSMIVVACNNANRDYRVENKNAIFCKQDTIEVIKLTTTYLEHLKNRDFDKAIQMIYHIQNDTVSALTEEERKALEQQYTLFPVLSYKIDGYYFTDTRNTEIAYSIVFFEKQDGDNKPNTLKFRLNPQRVKDAWYLSILNR